MVKYRTNKSILLAREKAKQWSDNQGDATKKKDNLKRKAGAQESSTPMASPDDERKIISSVTKKKQKQNKTPVSSRKKLRSTDELLSPVKAPDSAETVKLVSKKNHSPVKRAPVSAKKSNRQIIEESRAKARLVMENPAGIANMGVPVSAANVCRSTVTVSKPVKKVEPELPNVRNEIMQNESVDGETDTDTEVLSSEEKTRYDAIENDVNAEDVEEDKPCKTPKVGLVRKVFVWTFVLSCFFPMYYLLNPKSSNPLVTKSGKIIMHFFPDVFTIKGLKATSISDIDIKVDNNGGTEEVRHIDDSADLIKSVIEDFAVKDENLDLEKASDDGSIETDEISVSVGMED